jgi:ribosomal protein L9
MILEFIKDHPVGIPKGTIKNVQESFAQKLIDQGFAKESNQTALNKFRKSLQDSTKQKLEVIQEKEVEAKKVIAEAEKTTVKKDCGCDKKVKKEGEDCEECKKKAAAQKQPKVVKKTTKKK